MLLNRVHLANPFVKSDVVGVIIYYKYEWRFLEWKVIWIYYIAKFSILPKFGNVYWVFYSEKSVMNMLDPMRISWGVF